MIHPVFATRDRKHDFTLSPIFGIFGDTNTKKMNTIVIGAGLCGKGIGMSVIEKDLAIILAQEEVKEERKTNRKGISSGIMPAFNFSTSSGNTLRNMRRKNKVSRIKRKRI